MFNPIIIWKKKVLLIKKSYCSSSTQPPEKSLFGNPLFTVHHWNYVHQRRSETLPQRRSHQDLRLQILLQKAAPYASGASTEPQQQRQRLSRYRPFQRQQLPTVPSSHPAISDRQSSRINRRRPPSSTDCSGPCLWQSRVRRQQQHPRRRRRRKQ